MILFKDLRPIKKVYFILIVVISLVSFFYAYKYYKLNQSEYMYVLGGLGAILLGYSIYVLLNNDNQKTCNPSLWKVKSNVILPSDIGEPTDTDVKLCDAQTLAEYGDTLFFSKKKPGFYYDGSNVYTVDSLDDVTVKISTSNTNVSFYYLKGEKITTSGGGSTTTVTAPAAPTTVDKTCCYRDATDSCITFEQTFIGSELASNENFKKMFVNRAGNMIGNGLEYIGDFTILNKLNNTTSFIDLSGISPVPTGTVSGNKEVVDIPSFSWPECSPDFIKNMKPKMTKSLSQNYINIVVIDTWYLYTQKRF